MRGSSISSLFIFNRALKPTVEHPTDDDFAVCKIIYYYPHDAPLYQQQSHVGLAEGLIMFSAQFSEAPLESIHTEKHTHVLLECEPDVWLSITFMYPASEGTEKLQDLEGGDSHLRTFARGFYKEFLLFHGRIRDFAYPEEYGRLKEALADYTSVFLGQVYLRDELFEGFHYCQVDRKTYMLVLFLLNQLQFSTPEILHSLVVYEGCLVTTTLNQVSALNLYNYFSRGKQFRRLEQMGRPPTNDTGSLYGRCLPHSKTGFLYGIHEELVFAPVIHIENENTMKLCCWVNLNLQLILLLKDKEYSHEFFNELRGGIEPLAAQMTESIYPQHQKALLQDDTYKFIYYNNMNLAVKNSSKIAGLDDSLFRLLKSLILDMQPADQKLESLVKSIVRTPSMWVYSVNIIDSRQIFFILPPTMAPAYKIEEEVAKFANLYFHNIFTGF